MKHIVVKSPLNRGLISRRGMTRHDLPGERYQLSSEIQDNWSMRFLGSMALRVGMEYKGATLSNAVAYHIPFVYSNSDTAVVELTNLKMRVRVSETIISRASVSSAVTNGTFGSDISSWTDADETGATSDWEAGGYMSLVGTGFSAAVRTQQVTVSGGDANVRHALNIVVALGKLTLKVGSSSGNDDYISATLTEGQHSLSFVPTGNFHIQLSSKTEYATLVDSVAVASSGDMQITTPWLEADLPLVRYEQSADVIYVWCAGYPQYKIERRGTYSWSVVKYLPEDGPWRIINLSTTSLTPSALTGDITLTASAAYFTEDNVGSLFKITSIGQSVSVSVTAENQFSDEIRVIGVDANRIFTVTITGTWSATVVLQRSVGETGSWVDVAGASYTSNQAGISFDDGLDNQIVFYRIGVKTGGYTSGTAVCTLAYAAGGITGVVQVTGFSSQTSVSAVVLNNLGATSGSLDWYEGEWSDRRGFPSSGCLFEGRLWHGGKGKVWASASDAYESFDDEIEGDSRPISRTIGRGPVDVVQWLVPSQRLVIGADGSEWVGRSSGFDDPLTQDNFNLKDPSNQGSAAVAALKVDSTVMFVQKSGVRLFLATYSYETNDYQSDDLTALVPELHESGIVRLGLQRMPDTRAHCVLGDGSVAVMIFNSLDGSKGWYRVRTDGIIEDVVVLPGTTEDAVYYTVKRTINGSTVRYFERWAMESECAGGTYTYDSTSSTVIPNTTQQAAGELLPYPDGTVLTLRDADGVKIGNNLTVALGVVTLAGAVTYATLTPSLYKLADAAITYSGAGTTTLTAAHLAGETVVCWADGKDQGSITLNGSGIGTIPESVQTYYAGLGYKARYKCTKLSEVDRTNVALTQPKIVNYLGLILVDTHCQGIQYGPDFDNLDEMPLDDIPLLGGDGATDEDYIWKEYDQQMTEVDGAWDTDSRFVLVANAPRPANVLAAVISYQVNEKGGKE